MTSITMSDMHPEFSYSSLDEAKSRLEKTWSDMPGWPKLAAAFDAIANANGMLPETFGFDELAASIAAHPPHSNLMWAAAILVSSEILETHVLFRDDDGKEFTLTGKPLPFGAEFRHPGTGEIVPGWEEKVYPFLRRTPQIAELLQAAQVQSATP